MVQKRRKQVHRFTNNLQGLLKVMVKDFSWNIIPWNALLFEKTLKQYQFSIARITDLFKHISWHGETCRNKSGFSRYFLPTPMTDFHRLVIIYISCDTRSVGLGQNCLSKVFNGLKSPFLKHICSIVPSNLCLVPLQYVFLCSYMWYSHLGFRLLSP